MLKKNKAGYLTKIPRAPDYFNDFSRAEWNRLLKILVEDKLVTTLDISILEGACVNYGIYREMYDEITENGASTVAKYIAVRGGNSQRQGELTTMNKAFEQYTRILRMFSATPSSRHAMKVMSKDNGDPKDDDGLGGELGL